MAGTLHNLMALPEEIQSHIFTNLSLKELLILRLVLKNFRAIADSNAHFWSQQFESRLGSFDYIMRSIRPLESFTSDPALGSVPSYFKIYCHVKGKFFEYSIFPKTEVKYESKTNQLTSSLWPSGKTNLFFINEAGAIFHIPESIYRQNGKFKRVDLFFELPEGEKATSLCPFTHGLFVGTISGKIFLLKTKEGKIEATCIHEDQEKRAVISIQCADSKMVLGLSICLHTEEMEDLFYFYILEKNPFLKSVVRFSTGSFDISSRPQLGHSLLLYNARKDGGLLIHDMSCNISALPEPIATILTSHVITHFCFVGELLVFYTDMKLLGAFHGRNFSTSDKDVHWLKSDVFDDVIELGPIGALGFYIKTVTGTNWTVIFKEDGSCLFTPQFNHFDCIVWVPDVGFFLSGKSGNITLKEPSVSLKENLGRKCSFLKR